MFVALLVLPFAFQGTIIKIVKREANGMLNARFDFESLNLSFIRHFPNASISLKNVSLTGINEFEGDTLLSCGEISATVNLMSLLGDSGYEIRSILLDRADLQAIVHPNGKANWDIMKAAESPETATADTGSSSFKLLLRKITVTDFDLIYRDEQAKMSAVVDDLNLILSGNMTADHSHLKTEASIAALSFIMDKIPYLSKATATLEADIDADLLHNKYTFNDNIIRLNALEASIDGWVALLEKGYGMDLSLSTPAIDFKQILSLIPAIYAKDFKDIKASGMVSLSACAKGEMAGDHYPAFDLQLKVEEGKFQYPGLPKSVDNIAVDLAATGPGGNLDMAKIDVNKFHFEMAGNPFDLNAHISQPMSNTAFSGKAHGKINFSHIKEIYPLDEGTSLSGLLEADLSFAGRLSQIEKENYEEIRADGSLVLSNMVYKSPSFREVTVDKAVMKFSPRYVEINPLNVKLGNNDISANGKLEHFIPYILKNETVRGALSITSNYLNLNELMPASTERQANNADSSSLSAFEIPKNIDFRMEAKLKQVIFDQLTMNNLTGQLLVKDGKLDIQHISANSMGGSMAVKGYYSTAKDPAAPETSLGLDIKQVKFADAFNAFGMIRKLAPVFENIEGKFSMRMQLNTQLDQKLSPVYSTLSAKGNISSNEVGIKKIAALDQLAALLKNDQLANLQAKDLSIDFTVENGRLSTQPFTIKSGIGTMLVSGSAGIDQTLDYTAKIDLPAAIAGHKLAVNARIGGSFTQPVVSLDTKSLTEQATAIVKEQVEIAKDTVNKKLAEETAKQVEKLKAEAKAAGDALVQEAQKQGQQLISEANKTSNPLAKIAAVKAAEAAAQKLNEEATKKAQQLNEEAEKQGRKLIESAKIK